MEGINRLWERLTAICTLVGNLFPWFPLAGKAADLVVILLGVALITVIVVLLLRTQKR
jgi:hypothetical protein